MDQLSVLRVARLASGNMMMFEGFGKDDQMWSGEGPRQVAERVVFDRRFAAPPHVQFAVSMLDVDQSRNLRYRIELDDVTDQDFGLTVHLWDDTRIGRLAVSWLAIGEGEAEISPKRGARRTAKR